MKKISLDFFPLTLALGDAFCNRREELNQFRHYLLLGKPLLIISPRRYGKTSLAINAIQ